MPPGTICSRLRLGGVSSGQRTLKRRALRVGRDSNGSGLRAFRHDSLRRCRLWCGGARHCRYGRRSRLWNLIGCGRRHLNLDNPRHACRSYRRSFLRVRIFRCDCRGILFGRPFFFQHDAPEGRRTGQGLEIPICNEDPHGVDALLRATDLSPTPSLLTVWKGPIRALE